MPDWVGLIVIGATASFSVCTFSCLGTLAPVILTEGAGFRAGVLESLLFMSGKILLYSTLGAVAAWSGTRLPPSALYYSTPLSGAFLIFLGLWLRFGRSREGLCQQSRVAREIRYAARRTPSVRAAFLFLAGLGTSLLPCPAVLALLTLASGTHSIATGFLYGLSYGIGLLVSPVLIAGGGLAVIARKIRLEIAGLSPLIRTISAAVIIMSGVRILTISM